jgi:hypothetical protein
MINIHEAIYALNPTVVTIRGDIAYDADEQEVAYDIEAVEIYMQNKAYIAKRQAEYPPMVDYLDAIVKGDTEAQQAYIDACLAVKAKYPKISYV